MKRIIIITVAAAAGLWTYFAIAPFIDNAGESDAPAPAQPSTAQDTTESDADTATATQKAEPETEAPTAEETELSGQARYPVRGTAEHPASGNIRVIETPSEQIIRFEDYEGADGPELHVYLANDLDATDPVDLGPSRAHSGNINYGVPLDVDIGAYAYVLTWSEEDNELYNYAQIN